jgi:hypothetical protein
MNKYTYRELDTAYRRASNHGHLAGIAKDCACFRCLEHFKPAEITDWLEGEHGNTAMCPKCYIDAVLIEDKLDRVPDDLLNEMQAEYFGSVAFNDQDSECELSFAPNDKSDGVDALEAYFEMSPKDRAIRLFEADLILADRAEKAKK